MAVVSKEVEFALDGGIDQFTEEKHLQPPALLECVNLIPYNNGSWRRRNGFESISRTRQKGTLYLASGGDISAWKRAYSIKDQVLAHDGDSLYSYNNSYPSSSRTGWTGIDRVEPVVARRAPGGAHNTDVSTYDVGFVYPSTASLQSGAKGYLVTAYTLQEKASIGATAYYQVFVNVLDLTTGAYLFNHYILNSNTAANYNYVRVAVSGDNVLVTYASGTALYARNLTITSPNSWGTETNIATLGSVNGLYDVCGDRTQTISSEFAIIYESAVAGFRVGYKRMSIVGNAPNILQTSTRADPGGFVNVKGVTCKYATYNGAASIFSSYTIENATPGCDLYIHAIQAGDVATDRRPTFIALALPANYEYRRLGIESYGAANALVVVSRDLINPGGATNGDLYWITADIPSGTPSANVGVSVRGILGGKPFTYSGRIYFQMVNRINTNTDGVNHATTLLVDTTYQEDTSAIYTGLPAAVVAPRLTGLNAFFTNTVANIVKTTESDVFYTGTFVKDLNSGGINVVQYDFSPDNNFMQSAVLGDTIYFSGGVPTYYDGRQLNEIGFLSVPAILNFADIAASGTYGNFTYIFTGFYQQYDGSGDLHRSAPSLAQTRNPGGAGFAIDVQYYMNNFTRRQRQMSNNKPSVDLVACSSRANNDIIYQKSINGNQLPTQTTATIRITDPPNGSETIIYTAGGGIDSICPPSFTAICTHKNRIWGVGDDERTIWFSTAKREKVAPMFNEILTFRIDDDGTPITALGSLDDNLIVFKKNKLYYVSGDGPNENGTGSTLSSPQFVNTDIGCDNPRSLARVPNGLVFSGSGSIYMLSRGLTLTNIGRRVQTLLATYPVITSATVVSRQNQVRFTVKATESSLTGIQLVYDYELDRWFTFENFIIGAFISGAIDASTVDSMGRQWTFHPEGYCGRESLTAWKDTGFNVEVPSAYLKLAHLQAAGKNGFMRIQKVSVAYDRLSTDHGITISLFKDFSESAFQTKAFSDTTLDSLSRDLIQIIPNFSEVQAISAKISITDASTSITTAQGCSIIGLTLTVGSEGGQMRLAAAAQG